MNADLRPSDGLVLLLLSATLAVMLSSCHAQTNARETRGKLSPIESPTTTGKGEPQKPQQQISQVVRMMYQDSRGDYWFGTQNGAFRVANDSLELIADIRSETGESVTVKDIVEDPSGKIWIGHTDGVSSVEGDAVTNYYASHGLVDNDVWCIEADAKGNIWIGTIAGVSVFDGVKFVDFELPEGELDTTLGVSSTKMVHQIFEDSRGQLWFSTNAGLFSLADEELVHVSAQVGIKTNFINQVYESRTGEVFISTKEALYRLDGDNLENITVDIADIGKGIGAIEQDTEGRLWFVVNQHFLYTYDGESTTEYQKPADQSGPVIFQIYEDQSQRLWFVGYGGAFRLRDGEFVNVTRMGPW